METVLLSERNWCPDYRWSAQKNTSNRQSAFIRKILVKSNIQIYVIHARWRLTLQMGKNLHETFSNL